MSSSALQTLWSPGAVGAFGSALEPGAKVSRLLPGAPWPGLGAGGFRFAAAGGDVSLPPDLLPPPPLPSQAAGGPRAVPACSRPAPAPPWARSLIPGP